MLENVVRIRFKFVLQLIKDVLKPLKKDYPSLNHCGISELEVIQGLIRQVGEMINLVVAKVGEKCWTEEDDLMYGTVASKSSIHSFTQIKGRVLILK